MTTYLTVAWWINKPVWANRSDEKALWSSWSSQIIIRIHQAIGKSKAVCKSLLLWHSKDFGAIHSNREGIALEKYTSLQCTYVHMVAKQLKHENGRQGNVFIITCLFCCSQWDQGSKVLLHPWSKCNACCQSPLAWTSVRMRPWDDMCHHYHSLQSCHIKCVFMRQKSIGYN